MGCKQPNACTTQMAYNFWEHLGNAALSAAREASATYKQEYLHLQRFHSKFCILKNATGNSKKKYAKKTFKLVIN